MESDKKTEKTIDLGDLLQVIRNQRRATGAIVGGCTAIALMISLVLPKTYESTTLVQTSKAGQNLGGIAAMATQMGISIGGSSTGSTADYISMMKSRTVLNPIIDELQWEEGKRPTAKEFVKSNLIIENIIQTNLIEVKAKGRTPEEAQKISQGVVDNFLAMQTDKGKQTQSTLVQFLNERITEAKKDAEDARTKFAEYQQMHKVYSPDEQAKAAVAKMNAFDEAISNMAVQQKASQAKLDAVSAKLGDIRSSSQNFNINDNENVMDLRKQIVDAQVNLVGLQELYTEDHPGVITAKDKIAALQKKLSEEVNAIVASKYTSMNPTQAALIGEQANAQVSMAVAEASESAIKARKEEKEKELEDFPKEVLEYLNLQRDTAIKEEIYTSLVKQCENSKIQEAMESMDIQIIDPADLPDEDKPVGPKKLLITAMGFVLGCLISLGYGLIQYKREEA